MPPRMPSISPTRTQRSQGAEEGRRRPQVRPGAQKRIAAPSAGRLHARLHHHPQEAQLRAAQGRAREAHQRDGGHGLHPGRGAQPAGALGRARARWAGQGPSGSALQGRPRHSRRRRGERPQEGALAVRRKARRKSVPRRAAAGVRPIEPDAMHGVQARAAGDQQGDGRRQEVHRRADRLRRLDVLSAQDQRGAGGRARASIRSLTPVLEVRSRRVGGATYQVPVEVPAVAPAPSRCDGSWSSPASAQKSMSSGSPTS